MKTLFGTRDTNGQPQNVASIAARFQLRVAFLLLAKSTIKEMAFSKSTIGQGARLELVASTGVEKPGNVSLSRN
jgi:hypothetical protein